MECPRCASSLVRYALEGREAVVCESCGYIGVPVDHGGDVREVESWDDAVSRVDEDSRSRGVTVETAAGDPRPAFLDEEPSEGGGPAVVRLEDDTAVPDVDPNDDAGSEAGVACDVCGKAFESAAQLNGHMAVHAE